MQAHPRSQPDLRCPYCHGPIPSGGLACTQCNALHHKVCLVEHPECACCRTSLTEELARVLPATSGSQTVAPPSSKALGVLAVGVIALIVAVVMGVSAQNQRGEVWAAYEAKLHDLQAKDAELRKLERDLLDRKKAMDIEQRMAGKRGGNGINQQQQQQLAKTNDELLQKLRLADHKAQRLEAELGAWKKKQLGVQNRVQEKYLRQRHMVAWSLPAAVNPTECPLVLLPPGVRKARHPNEYIHTKTQVVLLWIPAPGTKAKGFFMGKFELSFRVYERFCKETERPLPRGQFLGSSNLSKGVRAVTPVYNLSPADVEAFCAWSGLRVPSESEWSLAARGASELRYPWGTEHVPSASNVQGHDIYDRPSPQGAFRLDASPLGCMDVSGNLAELARTTNPNGWVLLGGSWRTPDGALNRKVVGPKASEGSGASGFRPCLRVAAK